RFAPRSIASPTSPRSKDNTCAKPNPARQRGCVTPQPFRLWQHGRAQRAPTSGGDGFPWPRATARKDRRSVTDRHPFGSGGDSVMSSARQKTSVKSAGSGKRAQTGVAARKWVYCFGAGSAEGRANLRNLLGGKGAGLAEMSNLGLPVPPGFTITTEVCTHFYANGESYPDDLKPQVEQGLRHIEATVGAKFGDAANPLLVSVRSGARVSMPGMMDTVLNLGLNDITVEGLAKRSNAPRFAYDSYRRFIQMYGNVVLGVDHHHFEELLELHKEDRGLSLDTELTADDWKKIVQAYKAKVEHELGTPFPQDPMEQLWGAIAAVFGSWNTQRAVTYRRLHRIPEDWGTAVNVQAM